MKQSKYPRIGEIVKCVRGRCRLCDKPRSNKAVIVQVNCFRGDDEVLTVHADCIKDLKPQEVLQLLIEKGLV